MVSRQILSLIVCTNLTLIFFVKYAIFFSSSWTIGGNRSGRQNGVTHDLRNGCVLPWLKKENYLVAVVMPANPVAHSARSTVWLTKSSHVKILSIQAILPYKQPKIGDLLLEFCFWENIRLSIYNLT